MEVSHKVILPLQSDGIFSGWYIWLKPSLPDIKDIFVPKNWGKFYLSDLLENGKSNSSKQSWLSFERDVDGEDKSNDGTTKFSNVGDDDDWMIGGTFDDVNSCPDMTGETREPRLNLSTASPGTESVSFSPASTIELWQYLNEKLRPVYAHDFVLQLLCTMRFELINGRFVKIYL